MAKKRKMKGNEQRRVPSVSYVLGTDFENLCTTNYVSLDRNPEILTACKKIAELIGSMTIHLMANTKNGDVRVVNELSRKIDIDPMQTMTRSHWMQTIVMNLLLYGKGNSIVVPHTYDGIIRSLEPIAASRVQLVPKGASYRDYYILIDGKQKRPEDLIHIVYNPDEYYLWKGKGINVVVKDIANNLKQARETEKGFMESKWKPSLIVKVDGLVDEFSNKEGRNKILEDYVKSSEVGEPWLIPAEQFQVEQVKPLSLNDLAINSTVELDKKTIAAILGVPPFLLGVGTFDRDEWNNFIQSTIGTIAKSIEQEMTKKIILSPQMYLRFNILSLYDWSVDSIVQLSSLTDKGILNRNEIRDRLGYEQIEGLNDFTMLENYLPVDQIDKQKKVSGNE